MASLRGFLKDYLRQNFSVDEIVEKYKEWVSENTYMILSKWNNKKWKNDVFAVKCSKRGNDIYRWRVKSRFVGLSHKAEDLVFFNPKDRSNDKTTCALWTTLTYDTKLCSYKEAWEQIGIEFNAFMAYVSVILERFPVAECLNPSRMAIHIFIVSCSFHNTLFKCLGMLKVNSECMRRILLLKAGIATLT